MDEAEHSLEDALRDQLLGPGVIAAALKGAATELANGGDHERLDAARSRLAATELELKNLASAVAQGSDVPALLTLMSQRDNERLVQEKEVRQLQQATAGIATDVDGIVRELLTVLPRWRELMSLNSDEARPMLAQLIEGRLTMTPRSNEKGRFYEFRGTGTIEPVIAGTAHKVASPTGVRAYSVRGSALRRAA